MNKLILAVTLITLFSCGNKKTEILQMSGRYKDVFDVYEVQHTISHHREIIGLYCSEMPIKKFSAVTEKGIKECNKLHKFKFENKQIQKAVDEYISKSVIYFKNLEKYRVKKDQKTFFKIVNTFNKYENKFYDLTGKVFSIESFVHLKEDEYWKNIDKSNFIKSKDYPKYTELKENNFKEGKKVLKKIISSTTNFQEFSIYKIESGDQEVKHGLQVQAALKKYEEIFNKKEYSLYLFEAWVKWRALYQFGNGGSSKFSKIDNKFYDSKRKEIANVIFNYISKHKKDKMAINQFLVIAIRIILTKVEILFFMKFNQVIPN